MNFRIFSLLTLMGIAVSNAPTVADEPKSDGNETRIVLRISRNFIRKHQTPTIDETSPVDMCLFGARVTGTAHTVGSTSVTLETTAQDSVFTLHFKGRTETQQVANHPPVAVYSAGKTYFDAVREIHFDGIRFITDPPTIAANGTNVITGLDAPRGPIRGPIIRKRAWVEIERDKPASDEIGIEEVKRKVAADFNAETDQLLTRINGIVPYEKMIGFLVPRTTGWVTHLGKTKNYLIISPGPKEAKIATLPKDAQQMRAPMELWIKGRPEGENARSLLESLTASQRALDRFRSFVTGKEKKREGVAFTAVGDWWVLKIGEDLLEDWTDKIEEKITAGRMP